MRPSNAFLLLIMGVIFLGFLPAAVEAQTRIDLTVESVQMNASRLSANQNVEITAVIRNNGSESAENISLEVDVFKEAKRIKAVKDIPVLAHLPRSGSSQGLPISVGTLRAGKYTVVVRVDPDNSIAETDESNNEKKVDVYVSEPLA